MVNRGKSIYDFRRERPLHEFSRGHVGGRMKRTWVILKRTFPGRQFIPTVGSLLLKFACHAAGYALRVIEKGDTAGTGPRPAQGLGGRAQGGGK